MGLVSSIAAIVTGHMAVAAITRSGGLLRGTDMARCGLAGGYLFAVLSMAVIGWIAYSIRNAEPGTKVADADPHVTALDANAASRLRDAESLVMSARAGVASRNSEQTKVTTVPAEASLTEEAPSDRLPTKPVDMFADHSASRGTTPVPIPQVPRPDEIAFPTQMHRDIVNQGRFPGRPTGIKGPTETDDTARDPASSRSPRTTRPALVRGAGGSSRIAPDRSPVVEPPPADLSPSADGAQSLAASPAADFIAIGGKRGEILWQSQAASRSPAKRLAALDKPVLAIHLPRSGFSAMASDGSSLLRFDLRRAAVTDQRQLEQTLSAAREIQWSVAFLPGGEQLVTGGRGQATLWDLESGAPLRRFDLGGILYIQTLAVSPDGTKLAAVPAAAGQTLSVFRLDSDG